LASESNPHHIGSSPDLDLHFPPLPKTLDQVLTLIQEDQDTPDTQRLAKIVQRDPIIAALLLRRVNSVFHGVRRPVDDVRQAVILLGFQQVCNLVSSAAMMELGAVLTRGNRMAIFQDIMRVSIGAAHFAQELSRELKLSLQAKAFIAGLQQGIGRLVLLYNRPGVYEELWAGTWDDFGPRAADERKVFGADHHDLGARALKWWNFPEPIIDVIRNVARPGAIKDHEWRSLALTLSVSVSASEQLCMAMMGRKTRPFFSPTPATHALARMTKNKSGYLSEQVQSQRAPAQDFISLMVPR